MLPVMSTGRPPIIDTLRDATRALHADVEAASSLAEGGLPRYVWFVEKQYGFHAPLELRLARAPGLAGLLDLEARRRAHLFAADLLHFGRHPALLPRCAALPRVDTAARALGALYVLEGSTLAGAFLVHQLGRALGITPSAGAAGIAPYGAALRDMWVAYADALDRFVRADPAAEPEIVDAAQETFRRMAGWMRAPAPSELAPAGA
jgi:heme oxygenase (biliverdin-IX-beta and delta-forming)